MGWFLCQVFNFTDVFGVIGIENGSEKLIGSVVSGEF
jgi:hypothetical protein